MNIYFDYGDQVNYNATTHNIKLNENMQLGDILEKSLSNNLLMIHEVYGIYFIENDKSTYFGMMIYHSIYLEKIYQRIQRYHKSLLTI